MSVAVRFFFFGLGGTMLISNMRGGSRLWVTKGTHMKKILNRYKKAFQCIGCVGKATIFCDPCGDNDWLNSLKR